MKPTKLFLVAAAAFVFASALAQMHRITTMLVPVEESGVTGVVRLTELPRGGTAISVVVKGLMPGAKYVSLYYENDTCELEPDSLNDVVGGEYLARPSGLGGTHGRIDDDLDEVHSVSVRTANDLTLIACAPVDSSGADRRSAPTASYRGAAGPEPLRDAKAFLRAASNSSPGYHVGNASPVTTSSPTW